MHYRSDSGGEGFRLDRVELPATRHALQTARRIAKQTAAGAKLDAAQQVRTRVIATMSCGSFVTWSRACCGGAGLHAIFADG